jgi:hypothetical protein
MLGGVWYHPGGRYADSWDFALNPGEIPNKKVIALRAVMNMFTSPVTVVGNASTPLK